ncbi:MAG TPA: LytTR family transcriptional regulator DNA-binding domain-containing protein [Actinophytocola sp.]|uniref:LytR/AlgR family response regulator transcription factor n=1 Tax=Actinophytocola sp. TaxID=1872138 RepID=UPI002DBCA1E7|nr:LytTR family transcriptional regulator DNA-binding domain-containing protein [Actinophytocola sp.]HEU5473201.1 LytTR family transcriptional regulator DNA-binding domain-containing protein [Actinophytocola sp.]
MSTASNPPGLVVLAVDDEKDGMEALAERLNNNRFVRRVIQAFDATGALRILSGDDHELAARRDSGRPIVDAVFSDLKMPGLTGMEMAKVLTGFKPSPVLIFVTGHGEGEQAVEAFELGAVDFIPKPCDQSRMDRAIQRVLSKLRGDGLTGESPSAVEPSDDEVIPVELAGTTKLIPRSSVRWVEAQGDYARLFTSEGSHLVRIPLAQLEERWEKAGFVRIHRSYLVPVSLITELQLGGNGYHVIIGNGERTLPVSRRHTRELKDRITRRGAM